MATLTRFASRVANIPSSCESIEALDVTVAGACRHHMCLTGWPDDISVRTKLPNVWKLASYSYIITCGVWYVMMTLD